jgi:iron complex outermembrane receptor protein
MAYFILIFSNIKSMLNSHATNSMEDIRVVSTPIIEGNQLDRQASQKTTVSEEQVRDLNAQDAASALRKTPGVNISRFNPIGSLRGAEGGAVFIRGQGSSRPGAEIK